MTGVRCHYSGCVNVEPDHDLAEEHEVTHFGRDSLVEYAQDYVRLRRAVLEAFNPPDEDASEVSVIVGAIETAAGFIRSLPCVCTPEDVADGSPEHCKRCEVLGRLGDEVESR